MKTQENCAPGNSGRFTRLGNINFELTINNGKSNTSTTALNRSTARLKNGLSPQVASKLLSVPGQPSRALKPLRKLNKGQFDDWLRHEKSWFRVRERSAFMNRLFNVETVLA